MIRKISDIGGIERIRLSSLEPRLLTGEFVSELAKNGKVCPHFHISLQSGCDSVLQRMNRKYTTAEYEEKVALIRSHFSHPAITTDVITGFPMESDDEFNKTRNFLNRLELYECHVFKYSKRSGTAADRMEGHIEGAVKAARSDILIADSNRRKYDFMKYYIGRKVTVLTEDREIIEGKKYTVGYTPEYVRAALPVTEPGKIMQILCFDAECDKIKCRQGEP